MPNIGVLNGQFLPLEEIRVSVEDRGYQFGDGVYEVIRVYGGKPFHLADHLKRLQRSAEAIHIAFAPSREFERQLLKALELSQYREAKIYVQVTRGVAPRDHVFPDVSPTVVISVREMTEAKPAWREHGVSAITRPDLRWGRCYIKSLNLLPNVLAKQEARQAGAFEAIFVRDGYVMEGATSNVMVFDGREVRTPELSNFILAGVTRQVVLDLARNEGLVVRETPLSLEAMQAAQEIWLVGTTIEVLAVTVLDGNLVGTGKLGDVTKRLAESFKRLTASCEP